MASNKSQFISVVDDEADIAYLFRDALGTIEGVKVFAFTDPCLALEHFEVHHNNYGCVITDYRMPSMNGVELLEKVKEINKDVKRILVSAFDVQDDLFKDCQCVDEFLSKPIIVSELIEVVRQYVQTVEIKQNSL
jgi:DNA-binding NtrC family response regulator